MTARSHILVVDDDERLRDLLGRFLREHDFLVSLASDAKEARALLEWFAFDAMVLDVMMPGETGLQLVGALSASRPPILMLSALAEGEDRVAGLESGVEDYLTKPFEPKELLLRLQAMLRRRVEGSSRAVQFGPYAFHADTLTREGSAVYLTQAERMLLAQLAAAPGQPVSREQLAERLGQAEARSVDVHITRLRRKIEADPSKPHHIQTVRGAGYALMGRLA